MRKIINGKRYKFIISLVKHRNNFYFDVEAINLKNKTHSFINNVNYIISGLNVDIDDCDKMESNWEVEESEGKKFFKKAIGFISDNVFRKYLEKQLNLDQELGEWNKLRN